MNTRHVVRAASRREFLQASAAAAAAMLGNRLGLAAEAAPRLTVGCRDAMLKHTGQPDCWAALKAIGGEGVEAAINDQLALTGLYHPTKKYAAATDADRDAVRADLDAAHCRITAFCMFNRFDERPDLEVELAIKAAKAAQQLGVRAIRIDVVSRKIKPEQFLDFAVTTLKRVMAATEGSGVAFGIENHGHTTNNPDFLLPLFDRVGSPRLGLTLDTGNFYWYGHPLEKVYGLFETLAPRVVHTHCKSIAYPPAERNKQRTMGWEYSKYTCPIDSGDIDFRRVVGLLRKAGYANDLCVENESLRKQTPAQCSEILAREIRLLKDLQG